MAEATIQALEYILLSFCPVPFKLASRFLAANAITSRCCPQKIEPVHIQSA